MSETGKEFNGIGEKMRAEGLHDIAIAQFEYYYSLLVAGEQGTISASEISSVQGLPDAESTEIAGNQEIIAAGEAALDQTCIIKLNGGLGTSMGLDRAKSLLEVTDGQCFLDIIIKQCLHLRETHSCSVPLLFMNSFRTEADTLAVLERYPEFNEGQDGLRRTFLQNKVPRLLQDSLQPVEWPEDPDLEWCPPGHGDIYTALSEVGLLQELISKGYRYAFVSNADNLGATLTLEILGYFASNDYPFMMEVADRTAVDRKGGHLARSANGGLLLRESAQCPKAEEMEFQDISKYSYFNTNSLWIDLEALAAMIASEGFLKLPLIVNSKTVDPTDAKTPAVYQLETAMGAAISLFEGAQALRVPRSRFAPVKKTTDLLTLRSDYFVLSPTFHVVKNESAKQLPPVVELDSRYYASISDFEKRFPYGAPSMLDCSSLRISGDVVFGKDVKVVGDVSIENRANEPFAIVDGRTLKDEELS